MLKTGVRCPSPHFIFLLKASELPYPRLGLIVSKKVGPAVVRNRVKRCLREIFRHHKQAVGEYRDVVVIAKPSAALLTFQEIAAQVRRFLSSPAAKALLPRKELA